MIAECLIITLDGRIHTAEELRATTTASSPRSPATWLTGNIPSAPPTARPSEMDGPRTLAALQPDFRPVAPSMHTKSDPFVVDPDPQSGTSSVVSGHSSIRSNTRGAQTKHHETVDRSGSQADSRLRPAQARILSSRSDGNAVMAAGRARDRRVAGGCRRIRLSGASARLAGSRIAPVRLGRWPCGGP
jgi:hypothetical protein